MLICTHIMTFSEPSRAATTILASSRALISRRSVKGRCGEASSSIRTRPCSLRFRLCRTSPRLLAQVLIPMHPSLMRISLAQRGPRLSPTSTLIQSRSRIQKSSRISLAFSHRSQTRCASQICSTSLMRLELVHRMATGRNFSCSRLVLPRRLTLFSSQLFGTATIANNASLFTQVLAIAQQVFQPLRNVTDFQASVVLQPIPRTITNKGINNGGNSLGLDGSKDLICELRLYFYLHTQITTISIPTLGITAGPTNTSSFQSSISQSSGPSPKMTLLSTLQPSRSSAKALRLPSPRTFTTNFSTSITLSNLKTQLPGMVSGTSSF